MKHQLCLEVSAFLFHRDTLILPTTSNMKLCHSMQMHEFGEILLRRRFRDIPQFSEY